jgi:hypothetical protein
MPMPSVKPGRPIAARCRPEGSRVIETPDVVVVALASSKAAMGDVSYDSVAVRADAAIDSWKMQTNSDRTQE